MPQTRQLSLTELHDFVACLLGEVADLRAGYAELRARIDPPLRGDSQVVDFMAFKSRTR